MRALIILAVLVTPALAKMRPPDDGPLSADQIASVMRSRRPAFNRCFNDVLETNPKFTGKLGYRFTIAASGKVTTAAATRGTKESAWVDRCIVAAIKKIVFPRSTGSSTVEYPFISSQE